MKPLFSPDGQRTRVLQVGKFYPLYRGGMETHLQDLCRSIAPFVDVSVLVSNSARGAVLDRDGNIPVERAGSWANIASAPVCPGMVRAIRNSRADIVHLHCPNPMAVLSYLASGHSGHAAHRSPRRCACPATGNPAYFGQSQPARPIFCRSTRTSTPAIHSRRHGRQDSSVV